MIFGKHISKSSFPISPCKKKLKVATHLNIVIGTLLKNRHWYLHCLKIVCRSEMSLLIFFLELKRVRNDYPITWDFFYDFSKASIGSRLNTTVWHSATETLGRWHLKLPVTSRLWTSRYTKHASIFRQYFAIDNELSRIVLYV